MTTKVNARALAVVTWPFRPAAAGVTGSVILHIDPTSKGGSVRPGDAERGSVVCMPASERRSHNPVS